MIEIMRGKSVYQYRVNPYNGREIDRRLNHRNARWQRWSVHDSPEAAVTALLALERGDDGTGSPLGAPTMPQHVTKPARFPWAHAPAPGNVQVVSKIAFSMPTCTTKCTFVLTVDASATIISRLAFAQMCQLTQ